MYKNNIEFSFNLVPIRKHCFISILSFILEILEKKIKISKRVEDERIYRNIKGQLSFNGKKKYDKLAYMTTFARILHNI